MQAQDNLHVYTNVTFVIKSLTNQVTYKNITEYTVRRPLHMVFIYGEGFNRSDNLKACYRMKTGDIPYKM